MTCRGLNKLWSVDSALVPESLSPLIISLRLTGMRSLDWIAYGLNSATVCLRFQVVLDPISLRIIIFLLGRPLRKKS